MSFFDSSEIEMKYGVINLRLILGGDTLLKSPGDVEAPTPYQSPRDVEVPKSHGSPDFYP